MKNFTSIDFLKGFEAAIPLDGSTGVMAGDLEHATDSVLDSVTRFISKHTLTKNTEMKKGELIVSNEDYNADQALKQTGHEGIKSLIIDCGITDPIRQRAACLAVSQVLTKYFTSSKKTGSTLFAEHRKQSKSFNAEALVGTVESLFPENLHSTLQPVMSMEDFGVGMSTIIPDLRMAISVAIMQFHNGITSRVVSQRVATEPVVQYKRSKLMTYNVADPEEKDKSLLEVSKSPKSLTNQLIKIEPLKKNDTAGALVADNIIKFGVTVDLLKMALDDTKYGHGRLNRSDIVADGVKADEVYFSINSGATTEQFKAKVPVANNRLVMINNSQHAGMRGATIEFPILLTKSSKKADDTASTLLAPLGADEGLLVTIRCNPEINLRNGKIVNMGIMSVAKHHTKDETGTLITAALNDLYTALYATAGKEPALVGYTMDARYDEQNLRKSQTATRIETRPFVFVLPPGKNYILDTAIGQSEEDNGASSLVNVIKIGQDDKTLDTIESVLDQVYDMSQSMYLNPLQKGIDPGEFYVAGSLVRPRVIRTNIDINDIKTMRDSDLGSDVRSNMQLKISYLLEELLMDTMYIAQIPAGQRPVFRVITSSLILNTLFAVEHIHNHMSNHQFPNYDGVEYRRVLDSGIVLEFVTSLFDYMEDKILIIPVIPGAPDSILNWGHNWDHGTLVGNYNHSDDTATWNRMFASTREITLPTNPMGILLTVSNIKLALKANL